MVDIFLVKINPWGRRSHRVRCQICMLKKIQRGSATRMAISDLYPPKAEDCFSMICMKSSPVIPCGAWSSNPLKFLWYLYFLLKYDYFSIFLFLSVYVYLMKNVCQYFTGSSWTQIHWNFLNIFNRFWNMKFSILNFLTVRLSVYWKFDPQKKFFALTV